MKGKYSIHEQSPWVLFMILVLVLLAVGEVKLYRSQQHLKNMVSEGLMQLKEDQKDGVTMKGGKMMMLKGDESAMMEKDIMMSDGTKVTKDGMIIRKDGTKVIMKEGEVMYMDGTMMRK